MAPPRGHALDVNDVEILVALEANMLASIRLARSAVPHMRKQRWGRICFLASSSFRQPIRGLHCQTWRGRLWAWPLPRTWRKMESS